MPRDHRLNLGRYISNPFNEAGQQIKKLDFHDLFRSKPTTGEYPWNPSRFDKNDLTRRMKTRKVSYNPGLGHVDNERQETVEFGPTQNFEVFKGLGRFNRNTDYDFIEGRGRTRVRPQEQPDFDPIWMEAYDLSPTIPAGERADNPMPSMANPDPKGYIMREGERIAEKEMEGDKSVAQLLSEGKPSKKKEKKEERDGEKVVEEEKEDPEVKTV
jgi:hypothetical protein|tara:strand:- start:871 stop:1512 length:642 start_codon:yes stop_codon:yes gene_type:complete